MSALIQARARRTVTWKYKAFTLTGAKGWKGGRAALNSSGKVVPASSVAGLIPIGVFAETVDATSADAPIQVDLEREITVEYFQNATAGDACALTDVGSIAYMFDDQTVAITAAGRSPAGRIWDVDPIRGVGIEKSDAARRLASQPAAGAFAANDYAPTSIENDAVYAIPATAAASTVTLPAAAPDGTRAWFAADGTANAHTVQYRDATGPTNLTTALTASKRHLVVAQKLGGKWFANAYVSP